jgi:hypothetical protein
VSRAEDLQQPCFDEIDRMVVTNTASAHACPDGRVLAYSNNGWAYLGEGLHRYAKGADWLPPPADYERCFGG